MTKYERKIQEPTNGATVIVFQEKIVRLTLGRIEIFKEKSSILEFVFLQWVHLI